MKEKRRKQVLSKSEIALVRALLEIDVEPDGTIEIVLKSTKDIKEGGINEEMAIDRERISMVLTLDLSVVKLSSPMNDKTI